MTGIGAAQTSSRAFVRELLSHHHKGTRHRSESAEGVVVRMDVYRMFSTYPQARQHPTGAC